MCIIGVAWFTLWICRPFAYILSNYGFREIVQTRTRHAHERPPVPTSVCTAQIYCRRPRHTWDNVLHGARRCLSLIVQAWFQILLRRSEERDVGHLLAAGQPHNRWCHKQYTRRDLLAIQTHNRTTDDVLA